MSTIADDQAEGAAPVPPALRELHDVRMALLTWASEIADTSWHSYQVDLLRAAARLLGGGTPAPPPAPQDDESRCAVCGWPLDPNGKMCVRGNCSMRPFPDYAYALERAAREYGGSLNISRFKNRGASSWSAVSPVLAFQAWVERDVRDSGRKLTQDEYFLAQRAFFAAHPGQGPTSTPMGASSGSAVPPAPPPAPQVEAVVSEIRAGEENDGLLESTDLFVTGPGFRLLCNVLAGQSFTYSLLTDDGLDQSGTVGASSGSAVPRTPQANLLRAFKAGFQWCANGTDKHGEYNGGTIEDGFAEWSRGGASSGSAVPPRKA